MQQDPNTKGFTLLELLVVIAIIGIVSAISYPNFSNWSEDRKVRKSSERVASMLNNINSSTQRGNYAFVQLMINTQKDKDENISSKFITRGLSKSGLTKKIKDENKKKGKVNCSLDNSYWKDDGNTEIQSFTEDLIATSIDGDGAVCFSKTEKYYLTSGKLNQTNITIEGRVTNRYLIFCTSDKAKNTKKKCPTTKGKGLEKPAYLVEWSRFGTIIKYRWSGSDWTRL